MRNRVIMKTLWSESFQLIASIIFLLTLGRSALAGELVVVEPDLRQHIPLSSNPDHFINYNVQKLFVLAPSFVDYCDREYLVPSLGTEIATDESGAVILMRDNERLVDHSGSIRWTNDLTNGILIATTLGSDYDLPSGKTVLDCGNYNSTNCIAGGYSQSQNFRYTNSPAFTNSWKVPLYFWHRRIVDGEYVYGWVRLNRQLYYGYGGPTDGIIIHGWANRALIPTERLVFGPWVELNEDDEKISGRPILPERKISISMRRYPGDTKLYPVIHVPPELCLKYELAVGNLKSGFYSRHFDDGTVNRYTRPEPYGYALAVAVVMDYGFEWQLTIGRFGLKVVDEVSFPWDLGDEFFVKLVPHVQYPQEKFLFPP